MPRKLGLLLPFLLFGCKAETTQEPSALPPPQKEPEEPKPPPYTGSHPIDAATHVAFWRANHTPVEADTPELCRRLFADLIGRYPRVDEVSRDCAGKTVDEIARDLQRRDDYLLHAQRQWRDRLDTNDVNVSWRYLKQLYEQVDRLHKGDLAYADFALIALSHPGFVMKELQPEDRVRAAFRAFLGREATGAEAADLASLYRPWLIAQEPDPDFPYTYWFRSYVYPYLCQPLLHCSATMLGGGVLDLRGTGVERIGYEDLAGWQKEELQELGRLVVRQQIFWEAAADAILNRLLGWSDGGRFPREPGIVIPEVRQALAEALQRDGDYPAAERLVLTSWLYRQRAELDASAAPEAVFTSGPVKPAIAEVWLDSSLGTLFGDFGTCDPRYTDGFGYFLISQAVQNGELPADQLEAEVRKLHSMQGNRLPIRRDDNSGLMIPDFRYTGIARLIGGCPGFQNDRTLPVGMAFAFTQESLAELICQPQVALRAVPAGEATLENIVRHQTKLLLGRDADPAEVMLFEDARRMCSGDDCTVTEQIRSVCVALLGSAEMLFY